MQPAYTRIRRFTALLLGLMFAGQAAAFWLTTHFSLPNALFSAGVVMLPLLPALPFLLAGNPLRTLGTAIAYLPLPIIGYYLEYFTPPGNHGGTPVAYIAVLLYGFPLAILALWLSPLLCRCIGIQAVNDYPDA